MIIDCHCHAGTGDGLTGPWDTAAPLKDYLRRASQAGIERTVLFAAFHSDYASRQPRGGAHRGEQARSLLRLRIHPSRTRPGTRVRVGQDRRRALRFCRHQGASTRRTHHPRDLRGGAGLLLAGALRRDGRGIRLRIAGAGIPEVNFIIPHLGSFADDWRAQLALIDHLVRHPKSIRGYVGRASVRPAGAGGQASWPGQNSIRLGWAMAAPGR